jgi:hypothetical protein
VVVAAGRDALAMASEPVEFRGDADGGKAEHPPVGDHPPAGGGVGQLADRPGQQGVDAPVQPQRDRMAGSGRAWGRKAPRQVHAHSALDQPQGRSTQAGAGGHVLGHGEPDRVPRPLGRGGGPAGQRELHAQHRGVRNGRLDGDQLLVGGGQHHQAGDPRRCLHLGQAGRQPPVVAGPEGADLPGCGCGSRRCLPLAVVACAALPTRRRFAARDRPASSRGSPRRPCGGAPRSAASAPRPPRRPAAPGQKRARPRARPQPSRAGAAPSSPWSAAPARRGQCPTPAWPGRRRSSMRRQPLWPASG